MITVIGAPASVRLVSVSLTHVYTQREQKFARYSGRVKLEASAHGIGFQYEYNFKDEGSVPDAIVQAANMLKNELEALARATQTINQSGKPAHQEEDYEPLGDEDS